MRTLSFLAIPSILALLAVPALAGSKTYDVTITNVTKAQSFTPILVVTHSKEIALFEAGGTASPELEILAEGGMTGPLEGVLEGLGDRVDDFTAVAGLIDPGKSETVQVKVSSKQSVLSLVGMLIPTNDTFVAVDSLPLPRSGRAVVYGIAYDAGTEVNDQDCANIPGPICGGDPVSEAGGEGFIYVSNGFHDLGDGEGILAPFHYDWRNPVAKVTIQRVK